MLVKEKNEISYHTQTKMFRSAITHTAAESGFQPHLIEKDYYCSQVLKLFAAANIPSLIFKGGTLLAKCHAGFYRLSEDLDFTIPVAVDSKRKLRSQLAAPLKILIADIPSRLGCFSIGKDLAGSNESKQYNAELLYSSCINKTQGRILIEIGLREELSMPPDKGSLQTLLLDPFTNEKIVSSFLFQTLCIEEAYAEKVRAALCREKLAIRDFYDIDYAIKNKLIDLDDSNFINLITKKIIQTEAKLVDYDQKRIQQLNKKINTELVPTLNYDNINEFSLENIINFLIEFKEKYISLD